MKDMLDRIFEALNENPIIVANIGTRIKYYEYPENSDKGKNKLIIKPLRPPNDAVAGSDQALSQEFTYQIDVQSSDRKICKQVQAAIKQTMAALNFAQLTDGLDEYFEATQIFVDARRYQGITSLYDANY